MDDYSFRYFEKFVRSRDFALLNAADLAGTDGDAELKKLVEVIMAMEKAGANQHGGSAVPTEVQIELIHGKLANITRSAHAIARTEPGFDELFVAPKGSNPKEVLATAARMLAHLLPEPDDDPADVAVKADRVKRFTGLGLPADFATALQADCNLVKDDRTVEHKDDSIGHANTAAIGRLVKQGVTSCHALDAIFHNVYVANPDKLHAWVIANHVEQAPKHKQEPPTPPTPPPA